MNLDTSSQVLTWGMRVFGVGMLTAFVTTTILNQASVAINSVFGCDTGRFKVKDNYGIIKPDVNTGVTVPNPPVATASKAEDFYIQAGEKYDKGDYQGAIANYTQAISLNPNYTEAYLNRGVTRYNLGDFPGAMADFNLALKINPNYANAYYNRGNARLTLGDYKSAMADFNSALKINPNDADAYYNRGNAHSALKDFQGAIADYNLALKINPNLANAYYNRGLARSALGDKQGAIADFQQAANIYQKQGNSQDYEDALNRIRQLQQLGGDIQVRDVVRSRLL